jgi:UDP-N-acetylglucosamine 2-epimerase (non-hydrolysing)
LLQSEADLVLTDSGGVQEEACILQTPCVTIRESTERPESISVGANRLSGVGCREILDAVGEMYGISTGWDNAFGDGSAASKIVGVVQNEC